MAGPEERVGRAWQRARGILGRVSFDAHGDGELLDRVVYPPASALP